LADPLPVTTPRVDYIITPAMPACTVVITLHGKEPQSTAFIFMINKIFLLLPPNFKAYVGPPVCLIKVKICAVCEFGVQRIPNQQEKQLPS
jgi:hypothetical protein